VVLVLLCVNNRNLPLTECAVERAIDCLWLNSQTRRRVAINHNRLLQSAKLLIACRIFDLRIFAQFVYKLGRPRIQLVNVLIRKRVLVKGFRNPATHANILVRLKEKLRAWNL
jgi:hypothetical protein